MNEDAIRLDIQHVLQSRGFVYLHFPRNTYVEGGQPDIYGLSGIDSSVAIEVKRFEPRVNLPHSFRVRDLKDNQRVWLDWLTYSCRIRCFIGIGTIERPRQIWIVRWQEWIDVEMKLLPEWKERGEDSWLNMRISTEDLDKYAPTARLNWSPGTKGKPGSWLLPNAHPLNFACAQTMWPIGEKSYSLRFEVPKKEDAHELSSSNQGAPVSSSAQ